MKPIFNIIIALILGTCSLTAQENGFEVKNLEEVNSEYLDMHAIPFGKDLIITSARNRNLLICEDPDLKGLPYTDLYLAKGKEGDMQYSKPMMIQGAMRINYHDAVPSIHPNGKMMVFTRSFAGDPELKVLHLYTAEYNNGVWGNPQPVPFNSEDYSNLHPAWSPDGKFLYFSSNRAPGGDKDYNILKISYTNGTWGSPQVLSQVINTKKTEYFPFVDENNRLYFSSTGHKGYGGLDIFFSDMVNGQWTEPQRLDKPINSRYDDHAFVKIAGEQKGFLSSNRKGTKGLDDIYTWAVNEKPMPVKLIVINQENDEQLGDADVVIEPILKKIPNSYFVNKEDLRAELLTSKESAPLTYKTVPSGFYKVTVKKEGYEPLEITVSAEQLAAKEVYDLPLTPIKAPVVKKPFEAQVIYVQSLAPVKDARVVLIDKSTGKEVVMMTDANGMVMGEIDCSKEYEIKADKSDYVGDSKILTCTKDDGIIKLTLRLAPPVKKDLVIVLENIYYDYDKSNIRPDAANELDKVVRLMEHYPSMEIELGSHTDSRGNDAYNTNLSQHRATEAVEYIISRGIARNRITAQGYGESKLANHCANNVPCSEEEHQQNRRTEIKVTSLADSDVKIQYRN